MASSKKHWLFPVGLLFLCATLLASLVSLPEIVARLAYAAETGQSQAAKEHLARAADVSQAFQYVAKVMRPSVVSISSVRRIDPSGGGPRDGLARPPVPDEFSRFFGDDLFERFFEFQMPERGLEQRGLGSGVIVSSDGHILTNNHVIGGADEINVTLSDNRSFRATLVGGDEKSDIAVLKIDAGNLTPAQLGDSDAMQVGEWVIAVGSPFGLDQTVTAGIVSAKGRAEMGIADYEDFIQTDAAINPGNRGGPLVNLRGEVVGINTAIASRTGTYMGVGFAIPANMVRGVMTSILEKGEVQRGFLGVGIQDLSEELAQSFGYDSAQGVLVSDVVADGPGDKAGLKAKDIIVEVNGKPTERASQLRNLIASTEPGSRVSLVIFRDGARRTVEVEIGRLETPATAAGGREQATDLGMTVQTLTPEIARQLGEDENLQGVVVAAVEPGSLANRLGMRRGDIILEIGTKEVRNAADFRQAMEAHDLRQGVRMRVQRDGARRFVFFRGQ